ncbi:hypothetical protein ACFW6S_06950 [Streptomyces sp. NPDC058740]|uniref:hypothetical protein n=1 Tax=Streptomyces sp. NPDC058740 TaxID=3346619 RepID=UPI00369F1A9D
MRTLSRPQAHSGATLPIVADAELTVGYWCEALLITSPHVAPKPLALAMMPSVDCAIRLTRLHLRTNSPFAATPAELERALNWIDSGWRQALHVLRCREPYAFSVVLPRGAQLLLSIRPVRYLALMNPTNEAHELPSAHKGFTA